MNPFHRRLKPRKHYEDLYDRHTIKQCFSFYETGKTMKNKQKTSSKFDIQSLVELQIYFNKGERWEKREKTIKEWIEKDKDRDDQMEHAWETAKPKLNRKCEKCNGRRHKVTNKTFMHKKNRRENSLEQVLFMYECSKCKHRSAEYTDGEIYDFNNYCPKCNAVLKDKSTRYKHKIVFRSKCQKCDYTDKSEWDLREKTEKKKTKAQQQKEQEDFEQFKKEFCLSNKEGYEYSDGKRRMKELNQLFAKRDEREKNKELYKKAAEIEKINIWEAQKRMKATLKGKKFVKLKFKEPNIGNDISCEFRTYESDPSRNEKKACKDLENLIKKAFENTNWKLMSEGLSYRMGI